MTGYTEQEIINILKLGFLPSRGNQYKQLGREVLKKNCGCSANDYFNALVKHYGEKIK